MSEKSRTALRTAETLDLVGNHDPITRAISMQHHLI